MVLVNNLRYFSHLYFHGHTVGGTNPSLLEAMASSALICAHDNPFNSYILGDDAVYFKTANDVSRHLDGIVHKESVYQEMISNNIEKIREKYAWEIIVDAYAEHFYKITGTPIPKVETVELI